MFFPPQDLLLLSLSGMGVPELFDIDFIEGGIYVVGTLRNNGTRRFEVYQRLYSVGICLNEILKLNDFDLTENSSHFL